jgi:Na+/proline symporter
MPHLVKNWKEKKQVYGMRAFCLLFVILSYIFASMQIAIIVSIMSFSWGIVSGSFIGPYLWGLYSKKVNRFGAWAGMLSGFLTVIICTAVQSGIESFSAASANAPVFGVSAMAVSVVVTPLASLLGKKREDSKELETAWRELS